MTYIARNIPEGTDISEPQESTNAQVGGTSFQLSVKSAFVVGLITSVLTLCTIGFIVLLTSSKYLGL